MENVKTWFKNNQNTVWSVVGIVVVVAIIIIAAALRSPKDSGVTITDAPNQTALETANTAPMYYEKSTEAPLTPKLSYTDAVLKYGDRRIQFGDNCNATPAQSVWKTGSEVMLDNRGAEAKVFRVNNVSYDVAARDYAIASFTATTSPFQVLIDCGAMQNVATVTIQK